MRFGIIFSDESNAPVEMVEFDDLDAAIESARLALLDIAKETPAAIPELAVLIIESDVPRVRVAVTVSIARL